MSTIPDERLGIESALEYERDGFSQHLERGRGHHIAEQLDEVCVRGIGAKYERLLSKRVDERSTTLEMVISGVICAKKGLQLRGGS